MSVSPSAMITGASTGIGYATSKFLVEKGWNVFAGVRKTEDGERLKSELGEAVTPVICDVTDGAQVKAAGDLVREMLGEENLAGLVNNAGVAVAGPLLHLPIEDMQRQLEINVTGQLRVTQAFAPLLGAEAGRGGKPGRIVNISSVAGLSATPLVTPYACSKHALEAFTQGLRRELIMYGIDVVAINPGPIATPIWDKAEEMDPEQYAGTDYEAAIRKILGYMLDRGRSGLPPIKVAEAIYAGLTDEKPKLNTILSPEPFQQWLMSVLPSRMVDRLIAKRLGLTPDARR
ncbi:SDR family oxidoreductase [Maricaulaceae bacterium NA33B04]|nr:SDR family oxidoreductase [Maricaulaceae bacterium NA33B04]